MSFDLMLNGFYNEKIIDTMHGDGVLICDIVWGRIPKNPEYAIYKMKQKDIIDIVANDFHISGLNFFNWASNLPIFKDEKFLKKSIEVFQYEGTEQYAIGLPLAAFLGLPNKNPKKELKELANLLTCFLEKAMENQEIDLKIAVKNGTVGRSVYLTSSNKEKTHEFEKVLYKMIDASPILQAWEKNLSEAMNVSFKGCGNMSCSTSFYSFIDRVSQKSYLQAIKNEHDKKDRESVIRLNTTLKSVI